MNNREILAKNIKSLMKQAGIRSQADLASITGVSLTQISNILRHEKAASIDLLQRLADGLECESWQLLTPTTFLKDHDYMEFTKLVYCYMRLQPSAQEAVWSITQELYEATRDTLLL